MKRVLTNPYVHVTLALVAAMALVAVAVRYGWEPPVFRRRAGYR
jgi:hypothetical protein